MSKPGPAVVPVYLSLVIVWALTPLSIAWSIAEVPPFWALVIRFLCASTIMFLLVVLLRIPMAFDRQSLHSYLAGSLGLIVSQTFTYLAARSLASGLIALMFGLVPIVAGLMAYVLYRQRLHRVQWFGMVVALSGLSLISVAEQDATMNLSGLFFIIVAILCYAASIFWVQHIRAKLTPLTQATGSIGVSTLIGICYLPFIWDSFPQTLPGLRSILAIGYTVLAATVLAMLLYFYLIQNISATTLSLITVMTPMLAIFFGVVLNGEAFQINGLFGILLIISGLVLYFYRDLRLLRARRAS